jgi:hypothetical protein
MSVYFEGLAEDGTHVVVLESSWATYIDGEFHQIARVDLYKDGGTIRITLEDGRIFYAYRASFETHYTEFDGKELHERNYSY